jgi:DNA-binding XRE family transcriptional regulator
MNHHPSTEPLVNYVRVHRKKAGLSQSELGQVLGYGDHEAIARHECFRSLPPLLIAIGYEVIFQEPLTEIFAGLRFVVEQSVEQRLAELETTLRQAEVSGLRFKSHARKLQWLETRKPHR